MAGLKFKVHAKRQTIIFVPKCLSVQSTNLPALTAVRQVTQSPNLFPPNFPFL